ncbi:MAG: hypothetical protein IKC61_01915 [Clostridia bacterium]|nr:hypothetical protein [Clostridia bacterium]
MDIKTLAAELDAIEHRNRVKKIKDYEKHIQEIFSYLRYDYDEAENILEKLDEVDENTDEKQILNLLREFDAISCPVSKISVYPGVLIKSLSLLEFWRSNYEFSSNLNDDIMYTISFYDNFYLSDAYKRVLEDSNYDNYKRNGLFSPEERQASCERDVSPEIIAIEKMLTGKK